MRCAALLSCTRPALRRPPPPHPLPLALSPTLLPGVRAKDVRHLTVKMLMTLIFCRSHGLLTEVQRHWAAAEHSLRAGRGEGEWQRGAPLPRRTLTMVTTTVVGAGGEGGAVLSVRVAGVVARRPDALQTRANETQAVRAAAWRR